MHRWVPHETVPGLMMCSVCHYVRWPIEKRVRFLRTYGATKAYIYARPGYWYISDSCKTLTNNTSWSIRHDFCMRDEEDDYDD